MDNLFQDLRYAVRSLLRSPGMTFTALITLALGIGANTALFSVINGAFLAPPPGVGDADGLVRVTHMAMFSESRPVGVSYADYLTLRDSSSVFAELAAYTDARVAFASGGEPQQVGAELVTGDYFSTLRLNPAIGRGILPEENRTPGAHPVAVISHDLWKRRFGAGRDVLSKVVSVNGAGFTVVGVAPEGFHGLGGLGAPTDLWLPVMMHEVARPGWDAFGEPVEGYQPFRSVGRLRDGVSREQALAVMETYLRRMEAEYPEAYELVSAGLLPLEGAAGDVGGELPLLLIAMAVTLVILLIACANLANLLLARAARRRREIAVRSAVGASRARILQQLLTESVLLAAAGGAAGVYVALAMTKLFTSLAALPYPLPTALDGSVLLITASLSILTGVLVGLSPALRASKSELTPALKGDGSGGAQRIRPQNVLVAGQIALSFMLLVAAGLLVRSMWDVLRVAHTQPARDETVVVTLDLEAAAYSDQEQLAFKESLLERVGALPVVQSAAFMSIFPDNWSPLSANVTLELSTRPDEQSGGRDRVLSHRVWPGFFATTGLNLLRGRDFTTRETSGDPRVVVVNETAARQMWPGEDPLGKHIRVGSDTLPWSTVIGVVPDAAFDRPSDARTRPSVYESELQRGSWGRLTGLFVRGGKADPEFVRMLREQVHAIDPILPVVRVRTLGEHVDENYQEGWLAGAMLGAFGALALGLALIGLHGVVAFGVVQRTREVGIRMSLGASRAQVLMLFGRDVIKVAAAGLAVGFVIAAAVSMLLGSMISWIRPADSFLFVPIAALLLAVSLFSSYFAARRATKVDPMVALRSE